MKVIEGRITSPFGYRKHPITGTTTFHNGIDVAAPIGTPVYSPADGKISSIYEHATGGKTLIMHDTQGIRYGFCHLDEYCVKVGDNIKKKQLIAKSGNTGRSTGAHLHFTVKIGNSFVDPVKYLNIV
jgi:murein DD-endopeptidase MepM/ murein hydrolase activator NlpD